MKRFAKNSLALFLAFTMVFGVAPLSGFTGLDLRLPEFLKAGWFLLKTNASPASDFEYSISDGQFTITGYKGPGGDVEIPDTIEGLPVTSIGAEAFYDCTGLASISIPNSVTSIGECAFSGCIGLTSITIPDSVTSIGRAAFYECSGLTSIIIPYGVTSIGNSMFSYCTGLANVTLSNRLTSIGQEAFYACTGLASISIPNSVTSIGEYAFSYCTGLTIITIPNSVTSIGDVAFYGCSSLTSIAVATENSAFSSESGVLFNKAKTQLIQCPGGKTGSYCIPQSVTSIGDGAFLFCTGLTSITIPDSVTNIGDGAFSFCTGLTSITIPKSVLSIGVEAFFFCTGLTDIVVDTENSTFSSESGFLLNKTKTKLIQCPNGKTGRCFVPNGVTSIGEWAFENCTGLTSITIPDSVTNIGRYAFFDCISLTSITIPNSVTNIGKWAFEGCADMTIYGVSDSYAHTYAINEDIPFIPVMISPALGSGCVFEYARELVFGLPVGMTQSQFEELVQLHGDYSIEYSSDLLGTGTTISVIDNSAKSGGPVVAEFTIIIFGDVNGDGQIDANDAGLMEDYENWRFTWDPVTDAAFLMAADINGDSVVGAVDADILTDVENWRMTLDQTTGLAVPRR